MHILHWLILISRHASQSPKLHCLHPVLTIKQAYVHCIHHVAFIWMSFPDKLGALVNDLTQAQNGKCADSSLMKMRDK